MNYKRNLISVIVTLFCCSLCYSQSNIATVKKIVIIRHAEKPDNGDNLSCKGFNRSLQLAALLNKKFGIVDHILVPSLKTGKTTNHSRMFQTISPYAIQQNLNINTKYDVGDNKIIADVIRYLNGTVLLVWEHKNILKIVKELGIKESLKWDDNDFDSIWIITFEKGIPVLHRDTENLSPTSKCN